MKLSQETCYVLKLFFGEAKQQACFFAAPFFMENLAAFMDAARKYGKYPVTPANWE